MRDKTGLETSVNPLYPRYPCSKWSIAVEEDITNHTPASSIQSRSSPWPGLPYRQQWLPRGHCRRLTSVGSVYERIRQTPETSRAWFPDHPWCCPPPRWEWHL